MNAHAPGGRRRPTNVPLDEKLVDEARELGIDLSHACEAGLTAEIKTAGQQQWIEENRDAIRDWNEWVARNGLPLEKYRQF